MVVNFKVFKKCSPNNMITLYMNRREFVDSVTQVEPIGRWRVECAMEYEETKALDLYSSERI